MSIPNSLADYKGQTCEKAEKTGKSGRKKDKATQSRHLSWARMKTSRQEDECTFSELPCKKPIISLYGSDCVQRTKITLPGYSDGRWQPPCPGLAIRGPTRCVIS